MPTKETYEAMQTLIAQAECATAFSEAQYLLMRAARVLFDLPVIEDYVALAESTDDFSPFFKPDRVRSLRALFHPRFQVTAINHPLGTTQIVLTWADGRYDPNGSQSDLALHLQLEGERHLARFTFFLRSLTAAN